MKISHRLEQLKPSPTLALAALAGQMKAKGENVISLAVGEPDWPTVQVAQDAAIEAIRSGSTKYTPAQGTPQLREAIVHQINRDLATSFSIENVTVSSGGKFVIFSALQALLNPGDEVIIPTPYWVSYPDMVMLAEAVPVICQTASGIMKPAELAAVVTPKTKLLILNSPSNPSGQIYSAEDLKGIAEVLRNHPQVMVLSDDIYNRLVFEGEIAPHLLAVAPDLLARTLIINGVSKTYAMTGWRVGWAVGPTAIVKAMTNYQSQSVSCASSISQAAATAAIKHGAGELGACLKLLRERRDFVMKQLKTISGIEVAVPGGAFYVWPRMTAFYGQSYRGKVISGSKDLAQLLLEHVKLVTVPGAEFGADEFIRISYALDQSIMEDAFKRLREFLSELK